MTSEQRRPVEDMLREEEAVTARLKENRWRCSRCRQ